MLKAVTPVPTRINAIPIVPSYPGAIILSLDRTYPDTRGVRFQTRDSPTAIFAFYDQKLTETGWIQSETQHNSHGYVYPAKNRYIFTVLVTPYGDEQTEVVAVFGINDLGEHIALDDLPLPKEFKETPNGTP